MYWDRSKYTSCPPNKGSTDVTFMIGGEYNPSTKKARIAIIEPQIQGGYYQGSLFGYEGGFDRNSGWFDHLGSPPGCKQGDEDHSVLQRLYNIDRYYYYVDMSILPSKQVGLLKTPLGTTTSPIVSEADYYYGFKTIDYKLTVCARVPDDTEAQKV